MPPLLVPFVRASDPYPSARGFRRHFNDLLHAQSLLKSRIVGLACQRFCEKIRECCYIKAHPADRHVRAWDERAGIVLYGWDLPPALLAVRLRAICSVEIIGVHEIPTH